MYYKFSTNKEKRKKKGLIIDEGAKFSMMGFHHIGPDGSKPMGR